MNPQARAGTLIALILSLLWWGLTEADGSDLVWSTFLGGSVAEEGLAIAVGGDGCVYVTGYTSSSDFPTTAGALDTSYSNGGGDVFVAKFSPYGSELAYSTFLGGGAYLTDEERGWGIAVDEGGNAYVTGWTNTSDFPTTPGAYDTSFNGKSDAFVVKLNLTGTALHYATFLGGRETDYGYGIALDDSGNVYVTGSTRSEDFPTTTGAFSGSYNGGLYDAIVAKLNPTGSALAYSTFLGGNDWEHGQDIAVSKDGNAYVTGRTRSQDFPVTPGAVDATFNGDSDAFVAKLGPQGSDLDFATFLGGVGWDQSDGIAVDDEGNTYITGSTKSGNFPTTIGAFDEIYDGAYGDAFVVKLNSTGSGLGYATYLGGNSGDYGHGIAVDAGGRAGVIGETSSNDFPTTVEAFDESHNGGFDDVFVTMLNPTGSALDYSTFMGGSGSGDRGNGIALDDASDAFVVGKTYSSDFPTTAGAFDDTYNGTWDVFVAKLRLGGTPVGSENPTNVLPQVCVLHQNYPNPFNASTEIRYQILKDSPVTLQLFNILGQEVRTLVDRGHDAGRYVVIWDGRDDIGGEVASGVYFCTLTAGDFKATKKMVLLE